MLVGGRIAARWAVVVVNLIPGGDVGPAVGGDQVYLCAIALGIGVHHIGGGAWAARRAATPCLAMAANGQTANTRARQTQQARRGDAAGQARGQFADGRNRAGHSSRFGAACTRYAAWQLYAFELAG